MFLKQDKTKLRARELYKVVETFSENDQEWATVQKHNSQFRTKKYKVKLSELILLPGQAESDKAGTEIEVEETNDLLTTLNTSSNEEQRERPTRKAAMTARRRIAQKNLVVKKKQETPTLDGITI